MDFAQIKRVLTDLKAHYGPAPVNFSFGGFGEPLMYPHLIDAIETVDTFPESTLTTTTNVHFKPGFSWLQTRDFEKVAF